MITSEASLQTRAKVWWAGVPTITRAVFLVCVALYLVTALTGSEPFAQFCLSPTPVFHGQVYRFITSAVTHGGFLHLVLNMMAFLPLGASLERHFGSLQLLWIMLLLVVLGDLLYMLVASASFFFPFSLPTMLQFFNQCAVGLSGVIFGLVLIDGHQSGAATRSIFGLFSVPTAAFPWVLLVVWQMLVPHASLLGHLTGLMVGQAFVLGWARWALPSSATYAACERCMPCCLHSSSFIAHTGGSGGDTMLPTRHSADTTPHSGWLRGSWLPFPPSSARLHMSGLDLSSMLGGSAQSEQQEQQPGVQPAQGVRLGGGQAPADAKTAAAAAAEARSAGGSKSGRSSAGSSSAV